MIELKKLLKENIREYGMYIALVAIFIFFTTTTNGMFLSARNFSNLLNQTGYIAVLSIGVTLVIIIRHIDLSIGYIAGFMGAVIALLLAKGISLFIAIPIVLVMGMIIGLFNGFLVAKLHVPAFVATLAGMLIFRGALLLATEKKGSIIVKNRVFNALGNDFIPSFFEVDAFGIKNTTAIIVGLVLIIIYILSEINTRKIKMNYKFEVISSNLFILKLFFTSSVMFYIAYKLSLYNGISWTVVTVGIITFIYHTIMMKTSLGRHIYAVGGNPEAARLSGISVEKITLIVFSSMGMLAVISGMLYTSRLQSASTTAGAMFELDAIAGAYVGGVSASGGVGKVTNSVLGAIVMAALTNGMNLMGVNISYQYIIKGSILVLAVIFDIQTRKNVK